MGILCASYRRTEDKRARFEIITTVQRKTTYSQYISHGATKGIYALVWKGDFLLMTYFKTYVTYRPLTVGLRV